MINEVTFTCTHTYGHSYAQTYVKDHGRDAFLLVFTMYVVESNV